MKTGVRERMGPLKDQYGHFYVKPKEMREILDEYSSIFTVE